MVHKQLLLLLIALAVTACRPVRPQPPAATPLIPTEMAASMDGVTWWRAPIQVEDSRLPIVAFNAEGQREASIVTATLFPTDVLVVYTPPEKTVRVFLRRSPHGGCLLLYKVEGPRFEDPCYGSRFDLEGKYLEGPSPRNLDELPATVRGEMIWVIPQVIYGDARPAQ